MKTITILGIFVLSTVCYGRTRTSDYNPFPRYPHHNKHIRQARGISFGNSKEEDTHPFRLINRPTPPKPYRYVRSLNDKYQMLPEYQSNIENEPIDLVREARWVPRGNSRNGQTQQIRYVDGLPPPKQTRYVRSAHEFGLAPEYQNNIEEKNTRHARKTNRHDQPYQISKRVPPRPIHSV